MKKQFLLLLTSFILFLLCLQSLLFSSDANKDHTIPLDERPSVEGEWGYRPANDFISGVNPPSFTWCPMKNITQWELTVREIDTNRIIYHRDEIDLSTHTPSVVFSSGKKLAWKYRGRDEKGRNSVWSQERNFMISPTAQTFPLPPRSELMSRIPKEHPRLFVRPELIEKYRLLARTTDHQEYEELVKQCDSILRNPPSTREPSKYPDHIKRGDEEWRVLWWGNREYTIKALDSAATLAFVWNIDGNRAYAEMARKILLDCAKWDPIGSTGFRYNDEAGMPYNYHFSRTYTFLHSFLTEEEREICRRIMAIRGEEMFRHLFIRKSQFWTPYESHANRAWHFLAEIGIAFYNEIPDAEKWIWYSINVFYSCYPVWSDDDGGWHEGVSYWQSYIWRVLYWTDIMKTTFRLNAFEKPYFSQVGYYAMYLMPPGRIGGGFGDLCNTTAASSLAPLLNVLALQAKNPYWAWYAEQITQRKPRITYFDFIRKSEEKISVKSPESLPTSRVFQGTGQVMMNTNLKDAKDNVQLLFKSSPFGGWSHGYDASNSFYFSAWNENLLINTGRRDIYGSEHHKYWMWSTRSVNGITVNGQGQYLHSLLAKGSILHFESNADYDYVVGQADEAYPAPINTEKKVDLMQYPREKALDSFTRSIIFFKKQSFFLVYDQLKAPVPSTFEYWLHAINPFQPTEVYFPKWESRTAKDRTVSKIWNSADLGTEEFLHQLKPVSDQHHIATRVDKVACSINMLLPENLTIVQTNQYDPNPRARIKTREYHLTFSTTEKSMDMTFLTAIQAWKVEEHQKVPAPIVHYSRLDNGLKVNIEFADGSKQTFVFLDVRDFEKSKL